MTWKDSDKEDTTIYKVVMNHEEQYSIWPAYKELPRGWKSDGKTGTKSECLAHIKEVWTDITPLSLRKQMEEFAKNPPPPRLTPDPNASLEKSLVDRLCKGDHTVEVDLRPDKTLKSFKEAIDRNFIHIKFVQTKGGTELGFALDQEGSDLSRANFEAGTGIVHVEGVLTLDYVKVRCIADLDLNTLKGRGHLAKI
jgi:uncharacterized protein YbdZ (MbtH family)